MDDAPAPSAGLKGNTPASEPISVSNAWLDSLRSPLVSLAAAGDIPIPPSNGTQAIIKMVGAR